MKEYTKEEFPVYLTCSHGTYGIYGYLGEVETYKDNRGYIDRETGRIYICSKDEPPVHMDVPIVYVKDKELTKKDCIIVDDNDVYHVNNILELSTSSVMKNTEPDEKLYNEEAMQDMNAATSVFVPIIYDTDDPLKKVVKQIIISKEIDINRLKHKMPQKYGITNLRQGLIGETKMSITNFNIWCELLGVDYQVIITDNETDFINPLEHPVSYTSKTGELKNGEKLIDSFEIRTKS